MKSFVKNLVFMVVSFLVLFGGMFSVLAWPSLKALATAPVPLQTSSSVDVSPAALHQSWLEIPSLGISAPLQFNVGADQMEEALPHGAAAQSGSPEPGQPGNLFIVGHSSDYPWKHDQYATLFARNPRLKVGDTIDIYNAAGEKFTYKVSATKVVGASDFSVEDQTSDPTLTLLTCYPIGTTFSRFIVQAHLVR